MKKVTSLLIGCSLALAGAALAQQPGEQQSPSKSKRAPEKAHATQAHPGTNAAKPQEKPARQTGAIKERGKTNERSATNRAGADRDQQAHANHPQETNATAKATDEATKKPGAEKTRKTETHQEAENASATEKEHSGHAAGMPTKVGQEQERKKGQGVKQPMTESSATSTTKQQNMQAKAGGKGKKPSQQQVQQVKSQHTSFRAQAKPQQVKSVSFSQSHRVHGSEHWQGQQYEVFRSYRPQWHDESWYHAHYPHVTLIAGGYYYFNNGYWFPAWGYSPSAQYYAYDGPIYVGQHAVPPDQVIADVQSLLQEMGYYRGEVDGLLGPLTREALTAYQNDNGLISTAVIDQPTLDSLGLA